MVGMTNFAPLSWHTARELLHGAGLVALLACGGSAESTAEGGALRSVLNDADSAPPAASEGAHRVTSFTVAPPGPVEPAPSESAPAAPRQSETEPSLVPPAAATDCPYPNFPATSWSPTEWVPFAAGDPEELLQAVRTSMVGSWHGIASTPWTTPYEVELSFGADGSYSSRCSLLSESGCCVAFYYGTDDDTPLKQWRIEDASLSGNVFGEIDIAFDYFEEGYGLPAWQGKLTKIERDASGDGLRFEFQTDSGYGPVKYELRRSE